MKKNILDLIITLGSFFLITQGFDWFDKNFPFSIPKPWFYFGLFVLLVVYLMLTRHGRRKKQD
ncbi:hypothetical protein A4G20_01640 [Pasteurellaceae bacterium RH1A]|nr:hypothetical protein A4G20_01640 [Pasteurellaceae bacterium RH1A]